MQDNFELHYLEMYGKTPGSKERYKLSNKYIIEQITENHYRILPERGYIENFFGDAISNLSVIVGPNGSGKTSACRNIIAVMMDGVPDETKYPVLIIYSLSGNLFYDSTKKITVENAELRKLPTLDDDSIRALYTSNVFNFSDDSWFNDQRSWRGFENFSLYPLLKKANFILNPDTNTDKDFFSISLNQSLSALKKTSFNSIVKALQFIATENIPIRVPKYLSIELDSRHTSTNTSNINEADFIHRMDKNFSLIAENKQLNFETKFRLKFINRSVISIYTRDSITQNSDISSPVKDFFGRCYDLYFKNIYNTSYFIELRMLVENFSEEVKDLCYEIIDSYSRLYNYVFEALFKKNEMNESFENSNIFVIQIDGNENEIHHFVNLLQNSEFVFKPLVLGLSHDKFGNSSISSGELSLLQTFGNIMLSKTSFGRNSLLLLIDECDLGFHPQWQQTFIEYLTKFLNYLRGTIVFGDTNSLKKIQVILTTHSPIILSDLPSYCITYLGESSPKSGTFSANISELISDSFYLQDSLIGSFAKNKLDLLVSQITSGNYSPRDIPDILRTINLVAEPYLKMKLYELLENKEPDLEFINSEKKEFIRNQIKFLNKLISDDSN